MFVSLSTGLILKRCLATNNFIDPAWDHIGANMTPSNARKSRKDVFQCRKSQIKYNKELLNMEQTLCVS